MAYNLFHFELEVAMIGTIVKNFRSYTQYSRVSFEGHFNVRSLENVKLSYTGIQLHVKVIYFQLLCNDY